ncbi:DUF3995 domain-containing protein [Cohnella suwonensis]|uniref:DUF3995 domain-containing protein n=1 Tax=Cohnella suwonensis TaxID=696072 RepID=A0ABW0LQY3_9BACL
MAEVLAWLVGGVLVVLCGIHAYWAFGGKRGYEAALPEVGSSGGFERASDAKKEKAFRPGKLATLLVAALLAVAAWATLELGGAVPRALFSERLSQAGGWFLGALFLVRAVGDFKYLGLFKRLKGTTFARWDTKLYTPLCFLLGSALLTITVL